MQDIMWVLVVALWAVVAVLVVRPGQAGGQGSGVRWYAPRSCVVGTVVLMARSTTPLSVCRLPVLAGLLLRPLPPLHLLSA